MKAKIAINGYGRIGRNILRAFYESHLGKNLQIIAINDLCDPQVNAHLTQYDSIHGRFRYDVLAENDSLIVNGDTIKVFREKDISALPWDQLDIDIVFECTGLFTDRASASEHIKAGAKKVLISAPSKNADACIVYGVNQDSIQPNHTIISNASCTTNCLAPLAKIINHHFGIESGLMTTIHAYTNDQHLMDAFSGDLYRARSAASSMIPTKTGAATAVGLVLPELEGKLSGIAVRVPTSNVSLVDLSATLKNHCTASELNNLIRTESNQSYKGIVAYNDKPLVSIDFNHRPESCIFDATQTMTHQNTIKIFAWYDNEWGFSNRMLDTAQLMHKISN
ncbi:type I glyceraldehyde-3-phosphate dehydrogenase [Neptuniibacter sp. QD72_48]|uniref:type I glyceraldehyde-3-phosphate dehydrogenase n=1 Tax=unclassified Neptuniibacter TaxID=2630693 RepID=UPI0039F4F1BC